MLEDFKGSNIMNYRLLKLQFTSAVHFGSGGLTTTSSTLMADTVFSALCTEAARAGADPAELVNAVKDRGLRMSDALPYIGERFYVPRPLAEITTEKEGDSSIKKALKKLTYLPSDCMDAYLKGNLDIKKESDILSSSFGQEFMLEKAAVETGEETRPYAVSLYRYNEGSGLYICIGYDDEADFLMLSELMEVLGYSGIGGETSSGYGRFRMTVVKPARELEQRLSGGSWRQYMSLSACLPDPAELEQVMSRANFKLVKRSGWISPGKEASYFKKRSEVHMFAAGSVFADRFDGSMFDLGDETGHPVLRYGYPMLMGVN